PSNKKVDITIRRAQFFKGFAKGTTLYWLNLHNGDTVQTGSITQKYKNGAPKSLTAKGVKVYSDGNTFRIQLKKPTRLPDLASEEKMTVSVYPNPFNNAINFSIEQTADGRVTIKVLN